MEDILKAIDKLEDMRYIGPCSMEQINIAEAELGLKFADDYKKYLLTYGVISAKKIELTGISKAKRLDVVESTKRERELNPDTPVDAYMIENTAIDGIIIMQKNDGTIFSIDMTGNIRHISNSLAEYVLQSVNEN